MANFDTTVKRNDPEHIAAVIQFLVAETGLSPNSAAKLYSAWLEWVASMNASGIKPQANVWIPDDVS